MTDYLFVKKYKIQPAEWAMVKAMAGCDSDEVPGIPGIGLKSALDYLTGGLSDKKVKKIELAMLTPEFERDKRLVTLPLDNLEFNVQEDHIKRRKLIEMFLKYNFVSLMRKEVLSQWSIILGIN